MLMAALFRKSRQCGTTYHCLEINSELILAGRKFEFESNKELKTSSDGDFFRIIMRQFVWRIFRFSDIFHTSHLLFHLFCPLLSPLLISISLHLFIPVSLHLCLSSLLSSLSISSFLSIFSHLISLLSSLSSSLSPLPFHLISLSFFASFSVSLSLIVLCVRLWCVVSVVLCQWCLVCVR